MVSKMEVLEYCRVSSKNYISQQELERFFKKTTNTGGVRVITNRLQSDGLLDKHVKVERRSGSVNIPDEVEYIEISKGARGRGREVYVSLADKAYNRLEERGADSFYELPQAKEINVRMMTDRNPKKRRRLIKLERR